MSWPQSSWQGKGSVLETPTGIQSQWQVLVFSLRKGRQAHRNLDLSQNHYFPRASADNPGRPDTISFLWWLPWEFCRQLAFLPLKLKTREVRGRQGCNKSPLLWPLWPWPGCSTHELETTILSFGTRAAARRIHQISLNGTKDRASTKQRTIRLSNLNFGNTTTWKTWF